MRVSGRKGALTLVTVAVVAIIVVWLARHQRKEPASQAVPFPTAPLIKTGRPIRRDFFLRLPWFGKVVSRETVRVVSLAAGRIAAVEVKDGDHVQKDDVLFVLGGSQLMHTLSALEQHVLALKKQVALAREAVKRRSKAVAEGLVKKEALLSAMGELARLKEEFFTAESELAAFKDAMVVRSPMEGLFVNRQVSPGQYVKKGAHLADIMSADLRIIARLFPPGGGLPEGATTVVRTAGGAEIHGMVVRVLPKRTAEGAAVIWIEGAQISNLMRAGEKVAGRVVLGVRENRLALPRDAVVQDGQGHTFVFVKGTQGYLKKAVKIGLINDGWCEVISGITDNDEVVVRCAYELFYRNFMKTYKEAE